MTDAGIKNDRFFAASVMGKFGVRGSEFLVMDIRARTSFRFQYGALSRVRWGTSRHSIAGKSLWTQGKVVFEKSQKYFVLLTGQSLKHRPGSRSFCFSATYRYLMKSRHDLRPRNRPAPASRSSSRPLPDGRGALDFTVLTGPRPS